MSITSFTSGSIHRGGPLDDAALRRLAPSIFAESPMTGVSSRYRFASTASIIETLRGEGWEPVRAEQQPVRLEARAGFQMHMIRFARRDDITAFSSRILGDVRPELILRNSHDRSSSFRIDAGLFRLACLNGLVVSDRLIDRVTVPHVRVSLQAFVHAASHISERSPLAAETINRWRAHRLTAAAQTAFATQASALRWPDADFSNIPSAPGLLRVRRAADSGDDLWSVFNVLQENLIRGGVRYFHPQTGGRGKSRAIRSITENVRLNQELWQLAENFSRN